MSTEARAKMRLGPQVLLVLNVPDIPPSPLPDTFCVTRTVHMYHLNVRPCVPFASLLPRGTGIFLPVSS